MTNEYKTESVNETDLNRNDDIDSKIADFMADIDEIVLGKKSTANTNHHNDKSEWKQCYDETSQSVYYWNTKTNECSWDPPSKSSQNHLTDDQSTNSTANNEMDKKKRQQHPNNDNKSPKKLKQTSLIAAYTSSESETDENEDDDEENVDVIDELLNEVLDKKENTSKKSQNLDLYPSFEADSRAAIARLKDLGDKSPEITILRIQIETRLEDCLSGHLSKSYAVSKLEQALLKIEEFEQSISIPASLPPAPEPLKPALTTSEMALLLSLPPPPPPPSPPPPPLPPSNEEDKTLQLFYAQLNSDQIESIPNIEPTISMTKSDQHHHHHHHHKDKKNKPAKTLPTNLIQKWTHAQQELRGITDIDDS